MARNNKIGILGGTFDPIHNGHLFLAENLKHRLKLDEVFLLPNGDTPHKHPKTHSKDRWLMTKLAAGTNFTAISTEIIQKGPCYTIDTIRQLKKDFKDSTLYFLMGADNIQDMKTWKDWKQIPKEIKIVAGTRPGIRKK